MTDDNSRKSAITTIVTFVLLNIIWTGALTSAADQHLISPNSDIVTEYRFDGPDILGKEIPFHVFYEINEVEGMGSSEVTIELQLSDGTIIEVYSGISNASSTETYALLPGPSSFLITIKQDGQIYPVPSDIVDIDLRTEMELYTPIRIEGYVVANILALILIVTDRTLRSWAKSRRLKRGSPIVRKLRQEWKEVEKSISGGDPVDVDDLLSESTSASNLMSKRRNWSVEETEPEKEEGDQDMEDADAELESLDELGQGDESRLQGKATIDDDLDTISDLWDKLGDGQNKRRGP